MSHTPGPWVEGRHNMSTIVDDVPSKWVYSGDTYVAVASGLAGNWETVIANACLIAAAPDLLALAEAYEQWEADIILGDGWGPDGMKPFPTLTEDQYDRMLELQEMRNAAVKKAKGGGADGD